MKRYDGYEKADVYTSEYEKIELGGHICQIIKVEVEDKNYGSLFRIGFDIVEGPHKGYYKRLHNRKKEFDPKAKWPGMYYQTIKPGEEKYFKGFMVAIEQSNPGFKWDWDESKLNGKLFGGVFGQEEYKANDGSIKLTTKCRWVKSVEQVRNGVEIPEIKKLTYSGNSSMGNYSPDDSEDDGLPF